MKDAMTHYNLCIRCNKLVADECGVCIRKALELKEKEILEKIPKIVNSWSNLDSIRMKAVTKSELDILTTAIQGYITSNDSTPAQREGIRKKFKQNCNGKDKCAPNCLSRKKWKCRGKKSIK